MVGKEGILCIISYFSLVQEGKDFYEGVRAGELEWSCKKFSMCTLVSVFSQE